MEGTCPERMDEEEEAAVENCPERVDAEAPMPPRIETAVEFWTGVEEMMMLSAVDSCPERVDAL